MRGSWKICLIFLGLTTLFCRELFRNAFVNRLLIIAFVDKP